MLVLPVISLAQADYINELLDHLKEADEDTSKVHILIDLSENSRRFPTQAIDYAQQALDLSEKLNYKQGQALAHKYLGIGWYFQSDFVKTISNWQVSLELFEEIGDQSGVANMLSNLGAVYSTEGNEAKALDLYLKSLKISEEIKDSLRILTATINIGLLYQKNQQTHEKAREYYLKAIPLSRDLDDQDAIGTICVNLGEIYFEQEEYDFALGYFERSLEAFKESNTADLSYPMANIGKVYARLNEFQKAIEYQENALVIAKRQNSELGMSRIHLGLAQTYKLMGDNRSAINHYEKARDLSTAVGALYELKESYENLAKIYASLSDFDKAYEYQSLVTDLKDTLLSEDSQHQINSLQIQYQTESMLQENELLKRDVELREAKNKQQLILIYSLIIGFILVCVFIVYFIRAYNQKRKVNQELVRKNKLITEQKQEITDSIQYAKKIQNAVLTPGDYIENLLPERFILFRPRDIVSGDFYWLTDQGDRIICAIADCTGHGVPGAFMSLLGITYLNEIVTKNPDLSAGRILDELSDNVMKSLHQSVEKSRVMDGMDIVLIILDRQNIKAEFAGANNSLLHFRDNKLMEYKPDYRPIGFHVTKNASFTTHYIDLNKGDVLYAYSDGFQDQFGGPKGKKFMIKNFKNLLKEVHHLSMDKQKELLESALDQWMENTSQIDDILVMGIRI